MHPETHLALHRIRTAELRAEAEEYRLAASAGAPRRFRTRVGWTLIDLGLRLATTPRTPALAP